MSDPIINEGAAINQVIDPAPQGFEGGVGGGRPQTGDLAVEEGGVDQLQLLTHHNETLDGLLQLVQGILEGRLLMVSSRAYIVERLLTFMI